MPTFLGNGAGVADQVGGIKNLGFESGERPINDRFDSIFIPDLIEGGRSPWQKAIGIISCPGINRISKNCLLA